MKRSLNIALSLGIAAIVLSVLAVTSGTSGGNAATCNESIDTGGKLGAGKSAMYTLTFCSDPTFNFAAYVEWKNIKGSDLALRVTDPAGNVSFMDGNPGAGLEVFWAYAPLSEGDWTVEVINKGTKSVNFELLVGFG